MRFPIARVPVDLPERTQAVKHADQGEHEDSPWSALPRLVLTEGTVRAVALRMP